jgi:NitT/TauT family transport system substrate-binding protein
MPKIVNSAAAIAVAAAIFAAGTGPSSAADLAKVNLVQTHPVISVGEEVFIYAVPKRLGWVRDEGIELGIQGAGGATAAAQALQSGSVEFATTLPEVVMQVREQGGDVRAFYRLKRNIGVALAVTEGSPVKDLKELKGKTIGGMSWGSGGPLLLAHTLNDMGVAAGDYTRVITGTGAAAAAALQNKQIDALMLWDSMFAAFENGGMKLKYIDLPVQRQMPGFVVATTDRYAKANPKVVEGLCRAMNKGLYFARTNPEAAIRIFLEEFPSMKTPNQDPEKTVRDDVHILNAWLVNAVEQLPMDAKTGDFAPEPWDFTQKFYQSEGMLKGTQPTSNSFTNSYFEGCNNFDRPAVAAAAKQYQATSR